MKIARLAAFLALAVACGVATAQSYTIRITFNTNLRAAASLQARIIETAPAGTILNVVGNYDRWLRISKNGRELWMASWVGHTRVEDTAPTQTQTQTQANIDNCCFVDRQCNTDQEWTDGYWAFQNGHCAAPSASQTQTSTQTQTADSSQVNNCCFVDRQCHSDEDWRNGYHAYQNNQCGASQLQTSTQPVTNLPAGVDNCCQLGWFCKNDAHWHRGLLALQENRCKHPGIVLEGLQRVIDRTEVGLGLLRTRAPRWYDYAVSGYDRIIGSTPGPPWFVNYNADESWWSFTSEMTHLDETHGYSVERAVIWLAGIIIHEACHLHQRRSGRRQLLTNLESERECLTVQIEAMDDFNPGDHRQFGMRHLLANIDKVEYQWWHNTRGPEDGGEVIHI